MINGIKGIITTENIIIRNPGAYSLNKIKISATRKNKIVPKYITLSVILLECFVKSLIILELNLVAIFIIITHSNYTLIDFYFINILKRIFYR